MGRISTVLIKRTGKDLLEKFPDQFKKEYQHNKKALGTVAIISSKKLRNVIAGYLTRKVKQKRK